MEGNGPGGLLPTDKWTAEETARIMNAMMEDLGIGRVDALPIQDDNIEYAEKKATTKPRRQVGVNAAGVSSIWAAFKPDDVDLETMPENIADGQLYRQRLHQDGYRQGSTSRGGNSRGRGGHSSGLGRGDFRGAHRGGHANSTHISSPRSGWPRQDTTGASSTTQRLQLGAGDARLAHAPRQENQVMQASRSLGISGRDSSMNPRGALLPGQVLRGAFRGGHNGAPSARESSTRLPPHLRATQTTRVHTAHGVISPQPVAQTVASREQASTNVNRVPQLPASGGLGSSIWAGTVASTKQEPTSSSHIFQDLGRGQVLREHTAILVSRNDGPFAVGIARLIRYGESADLYLELEMTVEGGRMEAVVQDIIYLDSTWELCPSAATITYRASTSQDQYWRIRFSAGKWMAEKFYGIGVNSRSSHFSPQSSNPAPSSIDSLSVPVDAGNVAPQQALDISTEDMESLCDIFGTHTADKVIAWFRCLVHTTRPQRDGSELISSGTIPKAIHQTEVQQDIHRIFGGVFATRVEEDKVQIFAATAHESSESAAVPSSTPVAMSSATYSDMADAAGHEALIDTSEVVRPAPGYMAEMLFVDLLRPGCLQGIIDRLEEQDGDIFKQLENAVEQTGITTSAMSASEIFSSGHFATAAENIAGAFFTRSETFNILSDEDSVPFVKLISGKILEHAVAKHFCSVGNEAMNSPTEVKETGGNQQLASEIPSVGLEVMSDDQVMLNPGLSQGGLGTSRWATTASTDVSTSHPVQLPPHLRSDSMAKGASDNCSPRPGIAPPPTAVPRPPISYSIESLSTDILSDRRETTIEQNLAVHTIADQCDRYASQAQLPMARRDSKYSADELLRLKYSAVKVESDQLNQEVIPLVYRGQSLGQVKPVKPPASQRSIKTVSGCDEGIRQNPQSRVIRHVPSNSDVNERLAKQVEDLNLGSQAGNNTSNAVEYPERRTRPNSMVVRHDPALPVAQSVQPGYLLPHQRAMQKPSAPSQKSPLEPNYDAFKETHKLSSQWTFSSTAPQTNPASKAQEQSEIAQSVEPAAKLPHPVAKLPSSEVTEATKPLELPQVGPSDQNDDGRKPQVAMPKIGQGGESNIFNPKPAVAPSRDNGGLKASRWASEVTSAPLIRPPGSTVEPQPFGFHLNRNGMPGGHRRGDSLARAPSLDTRVQQQTTHNTTAQSFVPRQMPAVDNTQGYVINPAAEFPLAAPSTPIHSQVMAGPTFLSETFDTYDINGNRVTIPIPNGHLAMANPLVTSPPTGELDRPLTNLNFPPNVYYPTTQFPTRPDIKSPPQGAVAVVAPPANAVRPALSPARKNENIHPRNH